MTPPGPAGPERDTVPTQGVRPATVDGLKETELKDAALIVRFAEAE